jgi:hypothetical protein
MSAARAPVLPMTAAAAVPAMKRRRESPFETIDRLRMAFLQSDVIKRNSESDVLKATALAGVTVDPSQKPAGKKRQDAIYVINAVFAPPNMSRLQACESAKS